MSSSETAANRRRLYGRAKGQKLRQRPAQLMESLYPLLAVPAEGALEPQALFSRPMRALALEIGFGKGEHLVAQALADPTCGFIGCEPFLNGMAACVGQIETCGADNIRLYRGDALDVIERLPAACLERAFLLHPDPWPKARHAKRRFVNPGPLAALARAMLPGGRVRIATDHPVYMAHALEVIQRAPGFTWVAEQPDDWVRRPDDWPLTRYGAWAMSEGRPIWYLELERTAI